MPLDLRRPYLVVPKLILQPTWGGDYIVRAKGWQDRGELGQIKIGQSYELFSGSNLSLADTTDDPAFTGELRDNINVEQPTSPPGTIAVADLMSAAGQPPVNLLIKFTQALGNSFQAHIKAGLKHPKWLPKPESWYYFEPGKITLGVKPDADWDAYQTAVTELDAKIRDLGAQVAAGGLPIADAKTQVQQLLDQYDPWQYVNILKVERDQLVDLSRGGLHHSWEEDPEHAPLGNVLLELQLEALDNVSTFRSFDKGKLGSQGEVRPLQIAEYFEFIDRSPEANDPQSCISRPQSVVRTGDHELFKLMESDYYRLDKLILSKENSTFSEDISDYKHLFVKAGRIAVTAGGHTVEVGSSHSCFVPAGAASYSLKSLDSGTEVLVSY